MEVLNRRLIAPYQCVALVRPRQSPARGSRENNGVTRKTIEGRQRFIYVLCRWSRSRPRMGQFIPLPSDFSLDRAKGKAMSIKSLIFELTVASVLLAGCGPSQFVWVRGDEVTTTDSPLNFYDNAKPVSRDHAVCLEKFETCESTSRTVNDFGCPNAYSYCMDAAGYRKVPRQGKQ